jgi:hypothetical protein
MNILKVTVITCGLLILFGCAQIEDRKGSYVDLYPVDYRLSLHLEDATMLNLSASWITLLSNTGL